MARTVKPARKADTEKVKVKHNMWKASRMKAAIEEYHSQGDKGLRRCTSLKYSKVNFAQMSKR